MSYLAPNIFEGWTSINDNLFLLPIWKQEFRPSFLKPKAKRKEPKISMKWKEGK